MARVELPVPVPDPPASLSVSPVPDKTVSDAVDWYRSIGVEVTERWLKTVTDRRELMCRIVAGTAHVLDTGTVAVHRHTTGPHGRCGALQP